MVEKLGVYTPTKSLFRAGRRLNRNCCGVAPCVDVYPDTINFSTPGWVLESRAGESEVNGLGDISVPPADSTIPRLTLGSARWRNTVQLPASALYTGWRNITVTLNVMQDDNTKLYRSQFGSVNDENKIFFSLIPNYTIGGSANVAGFYFQWNPGATASGPPVARRLFWYPRGTCAPLSPAALNTNYTANLLSVDPLFSAATSGLFSPCKIWRRWNSVGPTGCTYLTSNGRTPQGDPQAGNESYGLPSALCSCTVLMDIQLHVRPNNNARFRMNNLTVQIA